MYMNVCIYMSYIHNSVYTHMYTCHVSIKILNVSICGTRGSLHVEIKVGRRG